MTVPTETTPAASAWPEGVIARYLTDAGGVVDVYGDDQKATGRCSGSCDFRISRTSTLTARAMAQSHAERCRALPRPKGV